MCGVGWVSLEVCGDWLAAVIVVLNWMLPISSTCQLLQVGGAAPSGKNEKFPLTTSNLGWGWSFLMILQIEAACLVGR